MNQPSPTHLDYAEEAQSAERGTAWLQAAALWRRAADVLRATAPHTTENSNLDEEYEAGIARCNAHQRVDEIVEGIAKVEMRIPTLRERNSDGLDFHEVCVWDLRRALVAAYEAGHQDAMPHIGRRSM